MINTDEIEVFPGKSLAEVLEDVYSNSTEKSKTITGLIDQLSDLIDNTDKAIVIVPLIKEYLEADISNDEQLIKVAQIIQRLYSASLRNTDDMGGSNVLDDAHKRELRELAKEFNKTKQKEEIKKLTEKGDDVVEELDMSDIEEIDLEEIDKDGV